MEEIVKVLLDVIKSQNETIIELTRMSRESPPQIVLPDPSPVPLNVSETEEDAKALFEAGLIDKGELQQRLKEIGFYAADIVVPSAGTTGL